MSTFAAITQFSKMLKNLDAWLAKAAAHAKDKGFDPEVYVNSRLAPDQYPLVRQVQSACDSAKFAAAHLAGQQAPAHPDTEKTIAELHTRIKACTDYLATVKEADFKGSEDRRVSPKWMEGRWVKGDAYLEEVATPNFYFHVTTAYAILRHNGVNVGKNDFIGHMPMNAP